MKGLFLGIDVGGTHTDGVVVGDQRILHKVKVPTRDNLTGCTLEALRALLDQVPGDAIRRVVLSTTLVTNTVVQGQLDRTAVLLSAGPGIDPALLAPTAACQVVRGAIDHRGREIQPLDTEQVERSLDQFQNEGMQALAVVGKFSVRNPSHEQAMAEQARDRFDHLCLGHTLAGALNFPRRIATAYLAAGVARRHREFIAAMATALDRYNIQAPLYLLRADGGTQLAASFRNPAETALSGPAASIMGIDALDGVPEETIGLDIGGTTTDISLFVGQAPLLEPRGATIGDFRTQIRSLFTRSTGAGGDSVVRVCDGRLTLGPERLGPPACLGGEHPTATDALVLLGRTLGDRAAAGRAIAPLAQRLSVNSEQCARQILATLAVRVAAAAREFVAEVNRQPVYTIHDLLQGHQIRPTRAVAVGGPARAIAPYIEAALDLPVHVPNHFDVANAVGAAMARVNLEVNLAADTARGYLSIPEADVYRPVAGDYSVEDAREEAAQTLLQLAREKGVLDPNAQPEVAECETFRIIEGHRSVGNIHHLRAQIRPGILGKVE